MLCDELTLYDQTCRKLYSLLAGRLPNKADLEATVTAYAYWVCTIVQRHRTAWETTIQDYAKRAVRDAENEIEAEQRELDRLRTALRAVRVNSWLLDIGAGWGRLSAVCDSLGWQTVSLEPSRLGTLLMQRSGHRRIVQATGEALPFPAAMFSTVLVGWVLHHDAPDLDAGLILREAARVAEPGGCLVSIEPLSDGFDRLKWLQLLSTAGFSVDCSEDFYTMPQSSGDVKQYALAVGTRLMNRHQWQCSRRIPKWDFLWGSTPNTSMSDSIGISSHPPHRQAPNRPAVQPTSLIRRLSQIGYLEGGQINVNFHPV